MDQGEVQTINNNTEDVRTDSSEVQNSELQITSADSGGDDSKQEISAEEAEELKRDDVCRDFLKNICNRGSRCKYFHPKSIERQRASQKSPEGIEYNFCIDYQNRGCHRETCRYIHAHRDDAERYKTSGEVTLGLARAVAAVHNSDTINGIPICKEYQTGKCSRGGQRCRYWHINVEEERERRHRLPRGLAVLPSVTSPFPARRQLSSLGGSNDLFDNLTVAKRSRYDFDSDYAFDLERKNAELMKELEGLKRELQRERERYDDLYALFRQRPVAAGTRPVAARTDSHYRTDSFREPSRTATTTTTEPLYQATASTWSDAQWTSQQ